MLMILTICGMDNDTAAIVLPVVTSLLIFLGGGLSKVLYDYLSKRKKTITSRNILFRWSGMAINATKNQILALEELSKSITDSKVLLPEPLRFSRNMADKLQDVSADYMTSLFVTNSKPKCGQKDEREKYAFNIVSQYDFLTAIQGEIRNNYEVYKKVCLDILVQWNDLMKKSQRDREAMNLSLPDEIVLTGDISVSQTLNAVFYSYMDGRDRSQDTFIDIFDGFVIPLNKAVDMCKTNYPKSTCGKAIYEDAREMLLIHRQWKANVEGYSEMFVNIASALQQSIDSLSAAVEYFENNTKVKCWCR